MEDGFWGKWVLGKVSDLMVEVAILEKALSRSTECWEFLSSFVFPSALRSLPMSFHQKNKK